MQFLISLSSNFYQSSGWDAFINCFGHSDLTSSIDIIGDLYFTRHSVAETRADLGGATVNLLMEEQRIKWQWYSLLIRAGWLEKEVQ